MTAHALDQLTDAHVLAMVLNPRNPEKSTLEAMRILSEYGDLHRIAEHAQTYTSTMPKAMRQKVNGALEFSRRTVRSQIQNRQIITNFGIAADYLRTELALRHKELFVAIWLDSGHCVISTEILSEGTINEAMVYPREVVVAALNKHASAVIFAHNHPTGGNTTPSPSDIAITKKLVRALKLVDIKVLDHLIVAGNKVGSMSDRGYDFGWMDEEEK